MSARDGKEERRERRKVREARKSNLSTRNFKQATGLGGRKRVTQGHNSSHPLLSPQARVEIHKFPLKKT